MTPPSGHDDSTRPSRPGSGAGGGAESWSERCGRLFEEMRRPARAMVARAYGRALSDEEIEDVYSAAWAATLAALRDRGRHMEEGELRAYIFTAVASHASKEMRRRSRKPSHPLADGEGSAADDHASLPDELAIGSETRGVARDLLTSLPERRRAVMLLRYGWGLSPKEVCALVPGLSPRAYRKEVTRGIEELIEGLRKVETGEWCADRERLVRDLVAGTADEESRRQAIEHLHHCQACASLAAQLRQELHAIGTVVALSTVAGSIGGSGLGLLHWPGEAIGGLRSWASNAIDKAESTLGTVAASGGTKGSGAVGASAAAKLAGAGTAVKAAVACAGAGVAATACVATGVIPGIELPGLDTQGERRPVVTQQSDRSTGSPRPDAAIASVLGVSRAVRSEDEAASQQAGPPTSAPAPVADPEPGPAPVEQPPPPPPPVEEFDPVASTAAAPSSSETGGSEGASGESPSATAVAQDEFGP